jgi:hypothetical protein
VKKKARQYGDNGRRAENQQAYGTRRSMRTRFAQSVSLNHVKSLNARPKCENNRMDPLTDDEQQTRIGTPSYPAAKSTLRSQQAVRMMS